jgi:hypothetical protein
VSAFHQRDFAARFGAMGDESEDVFLSLFPSAHRTGLNRPRFSMVGMKVEARYTPDFLLREGFYEVMGIGRDGLLKLKVEKLQALMRWHRHIAPTRLWVRSSVDDHTWCDLIDQWFAACHSHATAEVFPDNGKPYLSLHRDRFPGSMSDASAAA